MADPTPSTRAPALFLAHGSPTTALAAAGYGEALARFAAAHERPRALLVVSAHWRAPGPVRVTAAERPGVIHDFSGFPDALYALDYPAPGDPALARAVTELVPGAVLEERRGWDHGVWVPLLHLYPRADVPVVQVSLPAGAAPADLVSLGRALAPLRDRGVAIVGSGGIVHNLARLRWRQIDAPVDDWAAAFDGWVGDRALGGDPDALLGWRTAPGAALSVPTSEHLDPLFVALGAAAGARGEELYRGFEYGNLSMRSFAWIST